MNTEIEVSQSHEVVKSGNLVVIRNLELFAGYAPAIDDPADSDIKKYDRNAVARVIKRTNAFIRMGQHPRVVVMHSRSDGKEPPESIGRVLNVRLMERGGIDFIVGDVEMRHDEFDQYVASNAYPRRSAEIWNDGLMSEVALLGRDTPRRPLPDTQFSRDKTHKRSVHGRMLFATAGPSNTFVPSFDGKEKVEMATGANDTVMDEKVDEKQDFAAAFKGLHDEMCKCNARLEKMEKAVYGEDDEEVADDETKEPEDSGESTEGDDKNRRSYHQKYGVKSAMGRRIADLEGQLKAEKYGRVVDQMAVDGYTAARNMKDDLVAELCGCGDPEVKLKMWRVAFKRDGAGVRINTKDLSTGISIEATDDRDTVSKAVEYAAGDITKFKDFMAKAAASRKSR